jgi:hypothetical protein
MSHADRFWERNAMPRQELQDALLGTAIRFGDALRRFERRRRQRGLDHSCSRLLDETHVSGALLLALIDELGGEDRLGRSTPRAVHVPR